MHDAADATETARRMATAVRDVIAPMIAVDRGTIEWLGVDGNVAEIRLGGACAGCPGTSVTVDAVILPLLRKVDASITSVRVKQGV